jgi:hypothetical protein
MRKGRKWEYTASTKGMEEKTPVNKPKRESRIIKMRIHFLQELSRISRIPNVPQIIIATSDKKQ